MTKEINGERRYGAWAGNPDGNRERKTDCVAEVSDGWHFSQCQRKRGHGPNADYCRQHAKIEERRRQRQK